MSIIDNYFDQQRSSVVKKHLITVVKCFLCTVIHPPPLFPPPLCSSSGSQRAISRRSSWDCCFCRLSSGQALTTRLVGARIEGWLRPEPGPGNIWNPQKVFSWYIPGIYQVYSFPVHIPSIYLVYTKNTFCKQNLVFIHSNTYIALMSICSVQKDSVAGWGVHPSTLYDGKENSGICLEYILSMHGICQEYSTIWIDWLFLQRKWQNCNHDSWVRSWMYRSLPKRGTSYYPWNCIF